MNKRIVKQAKAYKVEIFIAGDIEQITDICQQYCDKVGLCVTVTKTNYVFTRGSEAGAVIGLINYARFPKEPEDIWDTASLLAVHLKIKTDQGSYTIQDHERSVFVSTRDEDQ